MTNPRYEGPERRAPDTSGVWKWLASLLAAMVISGGGTYLATGSQALRAEDAPWIRDSSTVMLRIRTLETALLRQVNQREVDRQRLDEIAATQQVILERVNILVGRDR